MMFEVFGHGLDRVDDMTHGESFFMEASHANEQSLDESELRDKQRKFFVHLRGIRNLSLVVAERK